MRIHNREPLDGHEKEVLSRQPPSDHTLTLIVECWHDLGSCRMPGYAWLGPIPWTAFQAWAIEHGLDWFSRQRIWSVIQRLDGKRAEREASKAANRGAS